MHYAARHPAGVSRLILSSTAAQFRLDETEKMMRRLGGDEAAQVARQFFSNPSEDAYETYGKVCLPLYSNRMHHRQEISATGPFSAPKWPSISSPMKWRIWICGTRLRVLPARPW